MSTSPTPLTSIVPVPFDSLAALWADNLAAGRPPLAGTSACLGLRSLPGLIQALERVPGSGRLEPRPRQPVRFVGQGAALGLPDADIEASLAEDDNGLGFTLAVTWGGGRRVPLPGLDCLPLEDGRLEFSISGVGDILEIPSCVFGGVFRSGRLEAPFSVVVPLNDAAWAVRLSGGSVTLRNVADLVALSAGVDLSDAWPTELLDAGELRLSAAEILFHPAQARIELISLTIATGRPLALLPGVEIDSVQTSLWLSAPGSADQSWHVHAEAWLSVAGSRLRLVGDAPELHLLGEWSGDHPLTFGDLAARIGLPLDNAPANLANCGFASLRVEADWPRREIACSFVTLGALSLGPGSCAAGPFSGWFVVRAEGGWEAELQGTLTLGALSFDCAVAWHEGPSFRASLAELPLTKLLREAAGIEKLPDEVPDLLLRDLVVELTPGRDFTLSGRCEAQWPLGLGGVKAAEASVTLAWTRSESEGWQRKVCRIEFSVLGVGEIAPGLGLKSGRLRLDASGADAWLIDGELHLDLAGGATSLAVSAGQSSGLRRLRLSGSHDRPLFDVAGLRFSVEKIGLEITASQAAGPGPETFDFSAEGRLRLDGPVGFDFGGAFKLARDPQGAVVFAFHPQAAEGAPAGFGQTAWIRLPICDPLSEGGRPLALVAGLGRLALRAGGPAGWRVEGEGRVAIEGLPARVAVALPSALIGEFEADANGVALRVRAQDGLVSFPLPPIELDGRRVEFGEVAFGFRELELRLGSGLELRAALAFGLPAGLNLFFGEEGGRPRLALFKTWDAAHPDENLLLVESGFSSKHGLWFQLSSSPFRAVDIRRDPDTQRSYWEIDLGEAGAARVDMPRLAWSGAQFEASGGFKIIRPLRAPTAPLKQLLRAAGLHAAADRLGAFIPISDIGLLQDKDVLDADALIALLEGFASVKLPESLSAGLKLLAENFNALPADLRAYLGARLPEEFAFDVKIGVDGGVRFDVSAPAPDRPLRLLFPTMAGGMPVLTGVTLSKLSFGEVLGGSLLLVGADLKVDTFDLVTLGAGLAAARLGFGTHLRPLDQVRRTLEIRDLTLLIFYQAAVPVPVPLFYSRLGFDYAGLEGFAAKAGISFPEPKINLSEIGRLASSLKRFATEPGYFLPAGEGPKESGLVFTIDSSFLELPALLGGTVLGRKDAPLLTLDAYEWSAALLNSLKRPSPRRWIEAIPVPARMNDIRLELGGMVFQVRWLLTTPAEFRASAWRAAGLEEHRVAPLLALLPVSPTPSAAPDEEGGVFVLDGRAEIAGLAAEARAGFGIALSDAGGCGFGFTLGFRVAGWLDFDASGRFLLEPIPDPTNAAPVDPASVRRVRLDVLGHARLRWADREVLAGELKLGDAGWAFSGRLQLFAPGSDWSVAGMLSGRCGPDGLHLAGEVRAAFGPITLADATFSLDGARCALRATAWGNTAELFLEAVDGGVGVSGSLLSSVRVGEVFALEHPSRPEAGPEFALRGPASPVIRLKARARCFGMEGAMDIDWENDRFLAKLSGQALFGLVACDIVVGARDFSRPGEFAYRIELTQRFGAFEQAAKAMLLSRVAEAEGELGRAAQNVERLRQAYEGALQEEIARQETAARARWQAVAGKLAEARQEVARLQGELGILDQRIEARRQEVREGRAYYQSKLDEARALVNSCRSEVEAWRRDIDDLENWYASLPDVDWPWKQSKASCLAYYTAESVRRRVGKEASEIALNTAEFALEKLRWVIDAPPVDLDPQIVELHAARGIADTALSGALYALDLAQAAVGELPLDLLDPERWLLEAEKLVGDFELKAARDALAAMESGFAGLRVLGRWMSDNASLFPVELSNVVFAGSLGGIERRSLLAQVTVDYVSLSGERAHIPCTPLQVDFDDVPASAAAFVRALLGLK